MNQCDKIIRYIKDFGSITTMQAFQDLGITRLSGRIYGLNLDTRSRQKQLLGATDTARRCIISNIVWRKQHEQGDY